MQILIQNLETEEILDEISSSNSQRIVGGGRSQFAEIDVSGSTKNSYAGVSITSSSFGGNPFLEFAASFDVIETDRSVSSRSSAYVKSGVS